MARIYKWSSTLVIESKRWLGKFYTTRANNNAVSKHNIRQGFCFFVVFFFDKRGTTTQRRKWSSKITRLHLNKVYVWEACKVYTCKSMFSWITYTRLSVHIESIFLTLAIFFCRGSAFFVFLPNLSLHHNQINKNIHFSSYQNHIQMDGW